MTARFDRSQRRDLRRAVRSLMESLGPSPSEVASSLADAQVVGVPRHPTSCAIARYLSAVVGSEPSVLSIWVYGSSVRLDCGSRSLALRVRVPEPVSTFIGAFDSGCYPRLIDRSRLPARARDSVPSGPEGS
jgi:hypothetical protein